MKLLDQLDSEKDKSAARNQCADDSKSKHLVLVLGGYAKELEQDQKNEEVIN